MQKPLRVLLVPVPDEPEAGRKGAPAGAIANAARVLLDHQRRSRPGEEWMAEFDLDRIPTDALCYRLGEVFRKVWDGSGPLPGTFMMEETGDGERRLRRQVVTASPRANAFAP